VSGIIARNSGAAVAIDAEGAIVFEKAVDLGLRGLR
jgi:hypothetical protein